MSTESLTLCLSLEHLLTEEGSFKRILPKLQVGTWLEMF